MSDSSPEAAEPDAPQELLEEWWRACQAAASRPSRFCQLLTQFVQRDPAVGELVIELQKRTRLIDKQLERAHAVWTDESVPLKDRAFQSWLHLTIARGEAARVWLDGHAALNTRPRSASVQ